MLVRNLKLTSAGSYTPGVSSMICNYQVYLVDITPFVGQISARKYTTPSVLVQQMFRKLIVRVVEQWNYDHQFVSFFPSQSRCVPIPIKVTVNEWNY